MCVHPKSGTLVATATILVTAIRRGKSERWMAHSALAVKPGRPPHSLASVRFSPRKMGTAVATAQATETYSILAGI